jgi:hypothetical protein
MNNKLWVKKKWDDATFAFNLHLISFQIADIKVKNLVTANQPKAIGCDTIEIYLVLTTIMKKLPS